LAALLVVIAGVVVWEKAFRKPAAPQKPVTVLIADFDNATSDPVFDRTLEPMFALALESAPFISSVNGDQVRAGATRLDESTARLVAGREGIAVVLAGSIRRQGDQYTLSARAVDAITGKMISQREIRAGSKEKVLAAIGKLAAPIRKALGDATPESAQLAAAETFTSASLEAAHSYALAQELQFAGKSEDAIREYQRAIQFDPNLGRAYAGLAVAFQISGKRDEAQRYYQQALSRIGRMTDREKYRTRGVYFLSNRNSEKAIEEFNALVKRYPADSAGHANLAIAWLYLRNMPRALEEGRKATEIYPKNVPQRNNAALYAMYSGDFEAAGREARAVLDLNPKYAKAYVALALSELAQGRTEQAMDAYRRLEQIGSPYAAYGLADLALYEGRAGDAESILEKSAAAGKLAPLAYAQLLRGKTAAAVVAADRAVAASQDESVCFSAAQIYLQAGQSNKARGLAAGLGGRLEAEPQAYARLIAGELALKQGDPREAIQHFQQANKLADTWLGHFDLGRAYLEAGAFTEADSEFDTCLKRRGEAAAVFLDEIPSYRYLPPVYYYLGRAREGLKSPGAAESYRIFLKIKEKGGDDPLVTDARKRLGK
jgi:tetratricopeptide (TPR) repeat protein